VSLLRIVNVPPRGIGSGTIEEWHAWAEAQGEGMMAVLARLGGPEDPLPHDLPLSGRAARSLRAFRLLFDDLTRIAEEQPLPVLLDELLARIGYRDYLLQDRESGEERWENVQELRTVVQEFVGLPPREALAAFIEQTALIADIDEYDERSDAVTLITLHQAKGLEFPVVFIVGMEEGLLPHARSMGDVNEMEEECRLCYVGMTRAKERLYLFRAFKRTLFGSSEVRTPSRYLSLIDPSLVSSGEEKVPQKPQRPAVQTRVSRVLNALQAPQGAEKQARPPDAFAAGDRVRHPTFGEGIVVAVRPSGEDQELTVAFDKKGLRRLLAGYARLERL
ncbi:MAG: 3'-5' exonuclease, partial [Chloroflexia bacterium]